MKWLIAALLLVLCLAGCEVDDDIDVRPAQQIVPAAHSVAG